jgi:AcrR family transcriptional regulator
MPRSKKASAQMRAESRVQILDAARKLFAEYGYFRCKVSDIAREAGMSQGNVYWYFSSKEDVLKAVLTEGFEAVEKVLEEAQSQSGTGLEKLAYTAEKYIVLGQETGAFFTIFMSLLAHGGTPFLQKLGFDTTQIGMRYHHLLSAIIKQAHSEGSVTDLEPDTLTRFFFAFFNGLMVTYGEDWMNIPPALIQSAVLRLVGSTTP